MTTSASSEAGEGSGAGGVCQPHSRKPLWIAQRLSPEQCFRVDLTVHQGDGLEVFGLSLEVRNPHTQELLAAWTNPTERYPAGTTLASHLAMSLRAIMLDLTDPDPF